MKGLLHFLFQRQNGTVNTDYPPDVEERFQEVREKAHSIARQGVTSHELVWRREHSVQLADDALRIARGDRR